VIILNGIKTDECIPAELVPDLKTIDTNETLLLTQAI
jgi:hypothetical protein